ncbi:hypothetical protein LFAB_01120 [Lactiplantibacillus fabifermentans T30PCM01]|uniref:Uncharacterized protein n=1 Tax=Lactiplantibacillus fabifermentans T30PCM01 TaxID=1400520 RepID=W6TAJ3_9LACO|nr:hypothetical protein LFAB_01120 [Lactiplantibacillus fabifermentans T30PCM01]
MSQYWVGALSDAILGSPFETGAVYGQVQKRPRDRPLARGLPHGGPLPHDQRLFYTHLQQKNRLPWRLVTDFLTSLLSFS